MQKHCCCVFLFGFFFSLSCCIDAAPVWNVIRELGIPKTICGRCGATQLTSRPCNPLIVLVGSEKNSVWRDAKLCGGLIRKTAFTMFVFFFNVFSPASTQIHRRRAFPLWPLLTNYYHYCYLFLGLPCLFLFVRISRWGPHDVPVCTFRATHQQLIHPGSSATHQQIIQFCQCDTNANYTLGLWWDCFEHLINLVSLSFRSTSSLWSPSACLAQNLVSPFSSQQLSPTACQSFSG